MKQIDIQVEITNKCILKCKHCSSIANTNHIELDTTTFIKFLNRISSDRKIKLTLTGGEPLLRFDLEELLEAIKNLNREIEVGIFTTGLVKSGKIIESISENKIRRLISLGLTFAYISIYSNEDVEHDSVTKEPLSFIKTIRAIKNFITLGVETNINLPLMKLNVYKLDKIIEYVKDIGVNEVRILKLINHGVASDNWNDIGVDKKVQLNAISKIDLSKDIKISFGGFLEIMSCQYISEDKKCLAGKNKIYIDNYGCLYPCGSVKLNKKMKIGNISEDFDLESVKIYGDSCLAYI